MNFCKKAGSARWVEKLIEYNSCRKFHVNSNTETVNMKSQHALHAKEIIQFPVAHINGLRPTKSFYCRNFFKTGYRIGASGKRKSYAQKSKCAFISFLFANRRHAVVNTSFIFGIRTHIRLSESSELPIADFAAEMLAGNDDKIGTFAHRRPKRIVFLFCLFYSFLSHYLLFLSENYLPFCALKTAAAARVAYGNVVR